MKISNNKDFRKLVVRFERQLRRGDIVGIAMDYDFLGFEHHRDYVTGMIICAQKIINNRSGEMRFEDAERLKLRTPELLAAVRANQRVLRNRDSLRAQLKSKRIRKQDEAPQVGADSSTELCDGCKNTFKQDHVVCPDCSQLGDV
ncbi:hypothetical protein ABFA21_003026 [Vibrio parahaemolyticus]